METSEKLLSSRLLSLLKNGKWPKDDVVKLFNALVKEFNGKNEDFHTWMMKLLHQVEIHKIVPELIFQDDNNIVDTIEAKINKIAKNTEEKTLDEILQEICEQAVIDEQTMAQVRDVVSSVSTCLSVSTAPHLQGIKQSLFKLCKAVEKTMKYKPRVTQMVSWCILVLSESSRLVQVGTGEGKSCIVAMFAAYQAMNGKTPDIISSSPVLAERDAEEWSEFYKELNITVDSNSNKSAGKELKKCYECQVVYGTTQNFAGDFLRQRFHRRDVRPERKFQCVIVDEVDSLMLDKGHEVVYLSSDMPLMESFNGILAQIWFVINQLKCLATGEILGPIQPFSQVLSEIMYETKNTDPFSIVRNTVDAAKQRDNASVGQTQEFLTMFVRNFPEYFFKLYEEGPDGTLTKLSEIGPADTNERQEISVLLLGNGQCRLVYCEEDSLVKSLGKIIKKSLQSESKKEQNESPIPGHQDLINGKIETWIENALQATKMSLGHEYILHGDGVAPVDYKCTGVVQNNMRWGEGLQQFLEMKHQTKLSNMSLITNFMSNVGLFKKYRNQVYGITGTLGDQTELDMLKKLYDGIDICMIPSFRQRKLYELEGMVLPEEDEWIRTVCNVVQDQVTSTVYRGPRAALVICETINRAEMFHKTLSDTIPKHKLKLYVNNNMDNSTIIDSTVQAGDVIIATNLAGRGTDLKVCEGVNEAGGLFVVQTFLPLNIRVENQAFGRTARQGSPGSAQLIMCPSHFSKFVKSRLRRFLIHLKTISMSHGSTESVFEETVHRFMENRSSENLEAMVSALTGLLRKSIPFTGSNMEKAKDARNTLVKIRLSHFLEKGIPKIMKKEELFSLYLDVLDRVYDDVVSSDQRDVIVTCLHECWGLWLLMHFSEEKPIEMLKEQLMVDLSNAKQKLLSKQSPSSMVYYNIRSGNKLVKNIKSEFLKMETSEKLLSSRLLSLLKNGKWPKDDVVKLFNALVKEFNGKNEDFHTWMMKLLHQVEIHKIVPELIFQDDNNIVDTIEAKINKIAKNTEEKTLDEILQEICEQAVIDEQTMAQVRDVVSSVSTCLSVSTAPHLQGIKQSLFKLCKAVEKTMKYKPRVTQMVSWCILVLSESSRLVQVGTGEGKSCIVAMFAAYQAMNGKTPDIISSSPVLAERDAEEWSEFYKELNITVDSNSNKSAGKELKKCYECQVVYGTTQNFSGDFLRQHFHRRDVRPERKFQCVIVDEVDSLMLDKGLEVVYLSSDMPLMESFNGILAQIWFVINQLKCLATGEILGPIQPFSQVLSEIMYETKNTDPFSIVRNTVDAAKQRDNASVGQTQAFLTMFVRNFPEYFFKLYEEGPDGTLTKLSEIGPADTNERQEISVLLLENGECRLVYCEEDSLVKSLGKMIKKSLQSKSKKEQNESRIPGHQDLINGKIETWIENALQATKMSLGHEYILHGDGVAPVDYKCTGVVQNNMRWGEGLQQFLEMKHQTKLSNMSLITNFMSNLGLFKKYTNQIYGITGTLGDQTELDMLKKLYDDIDICMIPSFRRRKLYELEGMVLPEEDEWIGTVCNVVQDQVTSAVYRGPRAALVICETINRAEIFHKTLADTIPKLNLKLYVNNNMDNSTIVDSTVQAGDVIIATNLAGRGTDLKVCEGVNEAGGLFVVQTFLPLNIRVENQAFGRTARQGSPGSAQLIMCASHFSKFVKSRLRRFLIHLKTISMSHGYIESVFEETVHRFMENRSSQNLEAMVSALTGLLRKSIQFTGSNMEKAKDARNTLVKIRLSHFLEKGIPKIMKKEELFSLYLDVLDRVYDDDVFSDQRDVIVPCLHECWGLWLLMHFSEEKPIEMLKEQLKVDLSNAKQKLLSKQSPSSMVYYYIRSGNNLREKGRLAESIEMYNKALEDGVCWEVIPLYNRALATITKKDTGYITQALADLEMADKAVDSYKSHLDRVHSFVRLSQEQTAGAETLLATQFQEKNLVVDLLQRNIQDSVMNLKRAESRGGNERLTEKHTFFLLEHINFISLRSLKQLPVDLMHISSLGLDTIFSLDKLFSFSGFLSKMLK